MGMSQAAQPHPCVKGIATDGAFATFSEVVQQKASWVPLFMQGPIVAATLALAGHLANYDPWSVRPVDCIGNIKVPLLLLHGHADGLVPFEPALRMARLSPKATTKIYHGGHDEPWNLEVHSAV